MNTTDLKHLKSTFNGTFLAEPITLQERLLKVKAYVFDWDGVFNNGTKDASGSSPFNEVDSMGVNMLRFNHFLRKHSNPLTAVVTGELNSAAFTLATREHFHAVYSGIKNKRDALQHFCDVHNIDAYEVAYFFDDVLDLSIAEVCGLRIMVGRPGSPLFRELVEKHKFADYITAHDGGNGAVREATELLMGIGGHYEDTIMARVRFSDQYGDYLAQRNTPEPVFYSSKDSKIVEQSQ